MSATSHAPTTYAIALGSNRPHGRHGAPAKVVAAAIAALGAFGTVTARAAICDTPALGPAGRRFANSAVLLESRLAPPALLAALKMLERRFGRRAGRRWGPRVLDLDIILWSGGRWQARGLAIPHPEATKRAFVLTPLLAIAAHWPVPGRTDGRALLRVRHAAARLQRRRRAGQA